MVELSENRRGRKVYKFGVATLVLQGELTDSTINILSDHKHKAPGT